MTFTEMTVEKSKTLSYRNLFSFWIFGLCNNFGYTVMLSAAQDILNKHNGDDAILRNVTSTECITNITIRICSPTSTGVVLLCNIIPSLCVKTLSPFVMHWIPYWVRHIIICVAQMLSFLITAFSDTVTIALCGVCLASFSSGLGETTYLGLAGHYSKNTIVTWSSGTGMAGIVGAFSYAGLTDHRLLALSSAQAMLVMLVVPVIFMFTFYVVLEHTETMKKTGSKKLAKLSNSTTKSKLDQRLSTLPTSFDAVDDAKIPIERLSIVVSLLRYMAPLSLTYFAEYLINQGLLELTVFDCDHGFGTSPASQYRWYQVLYQTGVFVSRSSIKVIQLNMLSIALMPVIQLINTVFFMLNAIYAFVPSMAIVCIIVLYEGLIGGGSYVNTFHHIHKKVHPSIREFALSTVSLADSIGILVAALVSIPIHNAICAMK